MRPGFNRSGILQLLLLLFVPMASQAQKGAGISVRVKNGILLNGSTISNISGSRQYTDVKNTFTQSICVSLSSKRASGVIFSGGVDVGYERYRALINYPFEQFGYERPAKLSDEYDLKGTIPFTEVGVQIGYRFKKIKNIHPEVLIGQTLHLPMRSLRLNYDLQETAYHGFKQLSLETRGAYGKTSPGFVAALLSNLYLGVSIPSKKKPFDKFGIGVQLQQQLISRDGPLSLLIVRYNDGLGDVRSHEFFRGLHTSANLVLTASF